MDPIKALLFDKDGTLFDFQATWGTWAHGFFAKVAQTPQEAAALHEALAYDPEARAFLPQSIAVAGTPTEITEVIVACLPDRNPQEIIDLIEETSKLAPLSEAVPLKPLLRGLAADGYRLGVATNDIHSAALANLEATGIRDAFEFVIGYDSGPKPKPAPDMVLAFAAHVGLPPSQLVMIGDSLHDLKAGRAAGARTVGVLTGTAVTAELAPFADVVLPNIGALPNWLAGLRE